MKFNWGSLLQVLAVSVLPALLKSVSTAVETEKALPNKSPLVAIGLDAAALALPTLGDIAIQFLEHAAASPEYPISRVPAVIAVPKA